MELATEVEEANEMKTVMEVPTEWTSEEELWWNNNWIDLRGSWNDMCDGSSNSSEVRSEWELCTQNEIYIEKSKSMFESCKWDWNLQLKWHQQCYEIKSPV
jgi:hypothetical protein